MRQYNFKITAEDSVINGIKISKKADSAEEARSACITSIQNATRDLGLKSLEFIGVGKLSAAQVMGAAGGKKSKRKITPEQQEKMQKARRKVSEDVKNRGNARSSNN